MIKLVGVTKTYAIKKYKKTAVNNISYNFLDTGFYCICVQSGCGKTTVLNLISGIDKPTIGDIFVNDKNLSCFSNKELNNYRSGCVGIVFQNFNLIEDYTVYENIAISLELLGEGSSVVDSKGIFPHFNPFDYNTHSKVYVDGNSIHSFYLKEKKSEKVC